MTDANPSKEEVKGVIDEKTDLLKIYHIEPLEKKLANIEINTTKEAIQGIALDCFSKKMREEDFRSKVTSLFNESLRNETFLKKVDLIAYRKINSYVKEKMMWAIFIWFLSVVASLALGYGAKALFG